MNDFDSEDEMSYSDDGTGWSPGKPVSDLLRPVEHMQTWDKYRTLQTG